MFVSDLFAFLPKMGGCAAPVCAAHPIILQTLHNLALATQMLHFARRFSHVPLFPSFMCFLCGRQASAELLPAIKHLHHVALWNARERKTKRKDADRGENDAWFRKAKKKKTFGTSKEADEEIGNEETGRLNAGKDAVSGAIQDQPAAHTVGSLCESQSVRSSAAVRPQRRLMRMHFFVFLFLINQQWDAQKTGCTLKLCWRTKLMKKPGKSSSGCAESC